MEPLISGIQQLGLGVSDAPAAFRWYAHALGMDVPIFEDRGAAELMTRYTGGEVHRRHAILAANLRGGGALEIWQFTSRTPTAPAFDPAPGDLGLLCAVIKSPDLPRTEHDLRSAGADVQAAGPDAFGRAQLLVRDPWGNRLQVVEADDWFAPRSGRTTSCTGGVCGAWIGVSEVERALPLYRDVLGYDEVLGDVRDGRVRRVLLGHRAPRRGAFSPLLGRTTLQLVQPLDGGGRRVLEDRYWGDLGYVHLCFDVRGMDALKAACADAGHPFTIDSADSFGMGAASGRFAYVEDPDGTLIELVETHRLPLIGKLGIGLDLRRRPPERALPRWLLRAMALRRVRA